MIRILILMCALSAPLHATTIDVNPERLVTITGTIDANLMLSTERILQLATRDSSPIWLYINSLGGAVIPSNTMIDVILAIRGRGVTVNCISTVVAASAAFNILTSCSHVYALRSTQFLFHPARLIAMQGLTVDDLLYHYLQLSLLEAQLQLQLRTHLGVSEEQFIYHYSHETMWSAIDLQRWSRDGWLTIITDISGIPLSLRYTSAQSIFGVRPYNYGNQPIIVCD